MSQITLDLELPRSDAADRVGFEIGWDHARHALVPEAGLLAAGSAVGQGWLAARAVFGARTLAASPAVRQWLALRLQAWREGVAFETLQVTPHLLAQIGTGHCPVTRRPLGGTADDRPVVMRLRLDAAYAAGNLVVVSAAAERARGGRDYGAVQRIRRVGAEPDGLDGAAWARLETLLSLAVEMPHALAARQPLRVLPPNRVRLLNAAQGLQAVLSLHLAGEGFSRRARALADALPDQALRPDFNLFVGAFAPRLLEALAADGDRGRRLALEDAWADERVIRRWHVFASNLGPEACEALAAYIGRQGVAGRVLQLHGVEAATEGWALPRTAARGRHLARVA